MRLELTGPTTRFWYACPTMRAGCDTYSPTRATSSAPSGTTPPAITMAPAYMAGAAVAGVGVGVIVGGAGVGVLVEGTGVTVGVGDGVTRLGKVSWKPALIT